MIRVVVIDDSAFMRKALQIMLESDPEIRVVGTARDGEEGFRKVQELQPDLVTLDIEMPRTNGLECIRMIMRDQPTPILVVSSVTTEGAAITLQALELGAIDFIPKSSSFVAIDITKIQKELLAKAKTISRKSLWSRARQRIQVRQKRHTELPPSGSTVTTHDLQNKNIHCIAIGVSTGGPPVVQKILSSLSPDLQVPILIAQHMPKEFTGTFAQRMNSVSALRVKEAEHGERLERGTAYVGVGGKHLLIHRRRLNVHIELSRSPEDLLYHPSADVLFGSAAEVYGSATLGLILTGMGKDGLLGLQKLKEKGGQIIAQNEASCVVFGMPKAVIDARITDAVLDIDSMIASLQTIAS